MDAVHQDQSGRTHLITGANTGIGRATAEALAQRGATVVLACRSPEKTAPVVDAINAAVGAERARAEALDLSDLTSVRASAARILERGERIDVLIANAGVAGQRGQTAQGFELAFGVNHLGHFLFTTLLLDRLLEGDAPRLVVVSSASHYDGKAFDLDAVQQPTRSVTGLREYAVSKLANVLFAQEVARRIPAERLGVHVLHPGVIASDVWRRVPRPIRAIMTRPMASTEEGAQTSLHCATSPDLDGVSGRYYDACAEKEPSTLATPERAAELWSRSEEWTRA